MLKLVNLNLSEMRRVMMVEDVYYSDHHLYYIGICNNLERCRNVQGTSYEGEMYWMHAANMYKTRAHLMTIKRTRHNVQIKPANKSGVDHPGFVYIIRGRLR